jgi:phage repressor protein C with HTH and peptisase S24 domain
MPRKSKPPDLTTQYGRLQAARERAGFEDRVRAADFLGVNRVTYNSHESGGRAKRGLPLEAARLYARRFKANLEWILTGKGRIDERTEGVAIAGFIGAGAEVTDYGDAYRFEDLGVRPEVADAYEWYEVRGDSMIPRALPGEFIGISKKHRPPREMLRRECLVFLPDGRRLFKILERGSGPGVYDLVSYNPAVPRLEDERVERVGALAAILPGPLTNSS